jgi:tetratricopeptide (TPR) repeat protein
MTGDEIRAKLERFTGFLQSDPGNASLARDIAELRYDLAYALLLERRAQEAREQLLEIAGQPDAPAQARRLLATVLHHCGDLKGAEERITAYLQDHPDDGEALSIAALVHLDAEHPERAREAAGRALQLRPDDPNALVTLGSLALERQDREAAEGYLSRVTQADASNGRAWSGMGLAAMLGLDLERARGYLERAVEHMPEHIGTWHSLAWCQMLKDDFAGAQKSFERALALDRAFGETHGGLAVLHVLQGRRDAAEREAKVARRLDADGFAGRFAESLLLNKSDPKAAHDMVRKILTSTVGAGGEKLQEALQRALKRPAQ